MRNNRYLLFGGMGFVAGALGALAAEGLVGVGKQGSVLTLVVNVALWAGVFGAFLSTGLFWAVEIYSRKPGVRWRLLGKAALSGVLAGALAGSVAQLVFSIHLESMQLKHFVLRPACWGIAGALIGLRLSRVIPNLKASRSAFAGGLGGVLGGYGFIIGCALLPDLMGRMLGVGLLGCALGLAIVVVELLFREALLEVTWAPKEVTSVSLGPQPVYIGGADDHIYVAGLPQHAAKVTLEQGRIEYCDEPTGKKTILNSGSRIKIGKIEIQVRAQT